jgi:hypothetical protein
MILAQPPITSPRSPRKTPHSNESEKMKVINATKKKTNKNELIG